MFCQVADTLAENRDLDLGGPCIGIVGFVTANQLRLTIFTQRHTRVLHERPRNRGPAPGTSSPRKSFSRTSATCYIRRTDGCKRPESPVARARPSSCPPASSNRTHPSPPGATPRSAASVVIDVGSDDT